MGFFHKPDGYRIYRAKSKDGHFKVVKTTKDVKTRAWDEPGMGEWCYKVTAIRGPKGKESHPTNTACVSVGMIKGPNDKIAVVPVMSGFRVANCLAPSPTPTMSEKDELLLKAIAAPNRTDGSRPVQLRVILGMKARVDVFILNTAGETVWHEAFDGQKGNNGMVWDVSNRASRKVASGIYSYVIRVDTGSKKALARGKILVIH